MTDVLSWCPTFEMASPVSLQRANDALAPQNRYQQAQYCLQRYVSPSKCVCKWMVLNHLHRPDDVFQNRRRYLENSRGTSSFHNTEVVYIHDETKLLNDTVEPV